MRNVPPNATLWLPVSYYIYTYIRKYMCVFIRLATYIRKYMCLYEYTVYVQMYLCVETNRRKYACANI